jgi:diaminohydroxyphosphoribosylaminopyrimidine deaminase/5-amino-6-(5-phosphoribosylamino)uracil reductase
MAVTESDRRHMSRAIELAAHGQGKVEPNPMVGCVVVSPEATQHEGRVIAEGWHAEYGGPHAEIVALQAAGARAAGATMFVSLEPCCHHGKTPPCTQAIIQAGVARVVVAHQDDFDRVAGRGIEELREAGLTVEVGVLSEPARRLNSPYIKLLATRRPWIIAKWAMTLDGKLATRARHSQWISNEESRTVVHRLRGRVDAVMVGSETVKHDDPRLTARPPGPRVAARIVVDSNASITSESRIVRTASQTPVLIAVSSTSDSIRRERLTATGCEIVACPGATHAQRLAYLLDHLGHRGMTNVMVEGGSRLLGSLWDANEINEVHVFIAAKIVGGAHALSPIAGDGLEWMPGGASLVDPVIEHFGSDIYVHGHVAPRND